MEGLIGTNSNSTVATLTTMSASLTFKNLPDDKKAEVFLHWLQDQSAQNKANFLDQVKQVINNGITENPNFYHYVIIDSNLTSLFVDQRYIDMINVRLNDSMGEDVAMVAFVDGNGEKCVVGPLDKIYEVIVALTLKDPRFAKGVCFKLDPQGLDNDEHTPMYLSCLNEILDSTVEALYYVAPTPANADTLLSAFNSVRNPDTRISLDFEITLLDGTKRKVAYFAPKPTNP